MELETTWPGFFLAPPPLAGYDPDRNLMTPSIARGQAFLRQFERERKQSGAANGHSTIYPPASRQTSTKPLKPNRPSPPNSSPRIPLHAFAGAEPSPCFWAGFYSPGHPVRELETLRDKHFHFAGGDVQTANSWLRENRINGNTLELALAIEPGPAGLAGIHLLKGADHQTSIGIDPSRQQLFVDRTQSGNTEFHGRFPGVYQAPIDLNDGVVSLRVFVDASSVEVFANEGAGVITSLVFPRSGDQIEFFGPDHGPAIRSLDVWTLRSIWNPSR